jgi:hypothetical protein
VRKHFLNLILNDQMGFCKLSFWVTSNLAFLNSILGRGRIKALVFLSLSVDENIPSRVSIFCLDRRLLPKEPLLFDILFDVGEKMSRTGLDENDGLTILSLV